jgi:hypothetical protein
MRTFGQVLLVVFGAIALGVLVIIMYHAAGMQVMRPERPEPSLADRIRLQCEETFAPGCLGTACARKPLVQNCISENTTRAVNEQMQKALDRAYQRAQ